MNEKQDRLSAWQRQIDKFKKSREHQVYANTVAKPVPFLVIAQDGEWNYKRPFEMYWNLSKRSFDQNLKKWKAMIYNWYVKRLTPKEAKIRYRDWEEQIARIKNSPWYTVWKSNTGGVDPVLPPPTENMVELVRSLIEQRFQSELNRWESSMERYLFIPAQQQIRDWSDIKCAYCQGKAYYKCPCFRIGYCTVHCQRDDWKTHKKVCSTMEK